MTEAEWLRSTDPDVMLRHLCGPPAAVRQGWIDWEGLFRRRGKEVSVPEPVSERKRRLLACACCWRIVKLFRDERSVAAVEAAECYADGQIGEWERQDAERAAHLALANLLASSGMGTDPTGLLLSEAKPGFRPAQLAAKAAVEAVGAKPEAALGSAFQAARYALMEWGDVGWARTLGATHLAALVRDVFGNPFRPVAIDPGWLSWNDGTVRRLAEAIYEERRFADLPILADALEEAGCADAPLLDHLRSPGPHVLGCWALDALLQRE